MSTSDSTTQIVHDFPDNSNNIQHTESDLQHKNPNKLTDSYTQKMKIKIITKIKIKIKKSHLFHF